MKELNTLSRTEAIEQVASLFIQADALVVDLANAPGYPDMMVLVKDCMPLFIFVRPDDVASPVWAEAKVVVEKNLAAVNATWFDATEVSDLDWVLGEVMHRTKPGEIKQKSVQLTAEQQGFDFSPSGGSAEKVATPAPDEANQRQRARKAWLE